MTRAENVRDAILVALQKRETSAVLASEYNSLCRDINKRLEQIEEVLDRGDEIQALQMAGIFPPVLDDADALCFFGYDRWNELCQSAQLSVAPEIRFKAVTQLNHIYGKGIDSSDPLYKQFREAILARDDESALTIARTIESLTPNEPSARTERERLEKRVFDKSIATLHTSLEQNDVEATLLTLTRIEQMSRDETANPPELKAAYKVRAKMEADDAREAIEQLIPQLAKLQVEGNWKLMLEGVAKVHDLCARHSIDLNISQQSLLENARVYSESKRIEAVKKADFREAEKEFIICLDDITSKTQARGTLNIVESRSLLTRLNKHWQKMESFSLPIDPARVDQASRLIEMLRNDIERLQKNKTITVSAIAIAAIIALCVSGWWILVQYRTSDMTRELQACQKTGAMGSVKKLIADAESSGYAKYSSGLSASIEDGKKWLEAAEKERNGVTEALSDFLKRSLNFTGQDDVRLDTEYTSLIDRIKSLPNEEQKLLRSDLLKIQKNYSDHLAVIGEVYEKNLLSELEDFEKTSAPLAKASNSLSDLKKILLAQQETSQKWQLQVKSPIKDLPLSSVLKIKAEANEEKIKALAASLNTIDVSIAALNKADNQEAFHEALRSLKEINLPCCVIIPEARIGWNTECTPDTLLPDLLFNGNKAAYEASKNGGQTKLLKPDTMLPAEVNAFAPLLNDKFTPDVKSYQLEGGEPSRTVYSKLAINSEIDDGDFSIFAGKIYDPLIDSPNTPSFGTKVKVYKASSKGLEKAKKFSEGTVCDASKIYRDLGLKEFVSDSLELHHSALELLERLTHSEGKDAIYQAYVIQQIQEMVRTRPYAWGMQYSPTATSLMKEVDQIVRVNCGSLAPEAWMAPAYHKISDLLRPVLAKPMHLNGEAQLNKLLSELIIDGSSFVYAGYVGEDGKARLNEIPLPPVDLFGISGDLEKRIAARVFHLKKGVEPIEYEETSKPMPFTPLYYVKNGRENILEAGLKTLRLDNLKNEIALPPLFSDLVTQQQSKP